MDESRYETVVIGGNWNGLPTTIRVEIFEEFFTLTVTLEFRSARHHPSVSHSHWVKDFDRIIEAVNRRRSSIPRDERGFENSHAEFGDSVSALAVRIWRAFGKEIFSACFPPRLEVIPERTSDRRREPVTQEVVADFRGFVLALEPFGQGPSRLRAPGPDSEVEEAATRDERIVGTAAQFERGGAERFADCLFPLLLLADSAAAENSNLLRGSPFEPAEHTWSLFDSGRTLYGSSFGPQGEHRNTPLYFVLLSAHDDHRTIGRIVNRLHTLGTLRVAALFDFDRMLQRDRVLSKLDRELNDHDETKSTEQLSLRLRDQYRNLQIVMEKACDSAAFRERLQGTTGASIPPNFIRAALDGESKIAKAFRLGYLSVVEKRNQVSVSGKSINAHLRTVYEVVASMHAQVIDEVASRRTTPRLAPFDWMTSQRIKNDCSSILRSLELIRAATGVEDYRDQLSRQVRRTLYSMSDQLRTGITYRANRSMYYRERFAHLSNAMHVSEVQGYQRYDEFVQQRLDRAFSLITSVSTKFSELQHRFDEIEKKHRSEREAKKTKSIEEIQKFGEIALFLFLVPVYLGHLLDEIGHFNKGEHLNHALEVLTFKLNDVLSQWVTFDLAKAPLKGIAMFLMGALALLVIHIRRKMAEHKAREQEDALHRSSDYTVLQRR